MLVLFFIFSQAFATPGMGPAAFPVFLKEGFSSILEFEEAPTQVVLGDQNLFQVEKLNRSIVIKPLSSYATTNMFVYFKNLDTKLFLLTASEEVEPTYYKKFEIITAPPTKTQKEVTPAKYAKGIHVKGSEYNSKKDYLTLDLIVAADSSGKLAPNWDLVRLKYKDKFISPSKLWSERREVQRDSYIKARFIFTKPNVPNDFKNVSIIVPVKGSTKSLVAELRSVR